jgi:hypothetical protein
MKMILFCFKRKSLKTFVFILSIILLVNLCACCEEGDGSTQATGSTQSVESDVQTQMNEDITNTVSVDLDIFTQKTIGNKDEKDALTVLKGLERAENEQKGDEAWENGSYATAAGFYEKAIKASDMTNKGQRPIISELYGKLCDCYGSLANEFSLYVDGQLPPDEYKQFYFNKAGEAIFKAGIYEDNPDKRAQCYWWAAGYKISAGWKDQACDYFDMAVKSANDANLIEKIMLARQKAGCK